MGTGARTPKPDEFPTQVRAELLTLRDGGVERFAEAWPVAVQTVGIPEGWDKAYPDQPDETPLEFARRHFAAAWEGEAALRYCQAEGCFTLTRRRLCRECRRARRKPAPSTLAA